MHKNENLTALIDKAIASDRHKLCDSKPPAESGPTGLHGSLKTSVDVEQALGFKNAMEEIDDLSAHFTFSRLYESPEQIKRLLTEFLESTTLSTVKNA